MLLTANFVNSFKACNDLPFLPIKIGFLSESIFKLITPSFNAGVTLASKPNELTKLAVNNKFKKRYRILLDVNGYKQDKYEKIIKIARSIAHEVQKTHTDVALDPMPADERRAIHNALAGMPHIKTESAGAGSRRQINIKYVD